MLQIKKGLKLYVFYHVFQCIIIIEHSEAVSNGMVCCMNYGHVVLIWTCL